MLELDVDQEFAEPVALSSTQPADRPLPRRALGLGLDLVALRARRTEEPKRLGCDGQVPRACRTGLHRHRVAPRHPAAIAALVGTSPEAPSRAVSPIALGAASYGGGGRPRCDRYRVCMARSSNQHPVLKVSPMPAEPPCPFCEEAYWRFNGRAWWACDRATGRRHVCSTPATVAEEEAVAAVQADRRPLAAARARRQGRASTALRLGLVAAVAVLAGIWIHASETE
jgi:hypothetical protein